jgi:hypothetical protein
MAEFTSARSGYGQTDAFPPLVSGGLLGRATIGSAAGEHEIPARQRRRPFFFLIGLALVMVWLTQQLYL